MRKLRTMKNAKRRGFRDSNPLVGCVIGALGWGVGDRVSGLFASVFTQQRCPDP